MLIGFRAKNHPQQTNLKGVDRHTDDRALPSEYFETLQTRFRFTIDVAASKQNAKLNRYYTEADNALTKSWAGERVYCNPPYSEINQWVTKAWLETKTEITVLLLPANRTEQKWWQGLIEPYRDRPGSALKVEFLKGRLRFLKPGESEIQPNNRPPFGCVLCIWEWNNENQ